MVASINDICPIINNGCEEIVNEPSSLNVLHTLHLTSFFLGSSRYRLVLPFVLLLFLFLHLGFIFAIILSFRLVLP